MATTTTKLLHLRPISTPSLPLPLHFSSSSSNPTNPPSSPPSSSPPPPKSSFSSYLTDVKASLNKHPPPPPPPPHHHRPFQPRTFDPPHKISSLEEIQKNLSQFRRLSAPPPTSGNPISLPELYKRHVIPKSSQENSKDLGFTAIRESLKHLKSRNLVNDGLKLNQESKKSMFENLPKNVFGKEVDGGGVGVDEGVKREFCRAYTCEELGRKLMELRPEKKKDERNWFSLRELSERLIKLRANDEEEMKTKPKTIFTEIRMSLTQIDKVMKKKEANINLQRINMLTNIGAEPDYMLSPPKEHLVEKYFHPDNMSSAEKLKIELKKVRDEFKMSESDCGSARVQVAQLTTKIKHLSTALHKKDKHSRKGLQAMVQQRKKLLKYLRRTDWDSYCLVLSKLGLRDNPDYKN